MAKLYSSELLNYVEPELVGGFFKTAFYSKVNTNFNVGDRVFIINGNYESGNLITTDKYKKGRDGYKVISIDRCRIVLDIDFTGILPYNQFDIDTLIKVHYISTQREFDYINRVLIEPSYATSADYKIEIGHTSLIYAAGPFTGGSTDGSIVWTGITSSGFWLRVSGVWTDVTTEILNNTLYFSGPTPFFSNTVNGKLMILGDSFEHNGKLYQEKVIYEYVNGEWVVDESYQPAIISKLNFRDGNFKGVWNDGIYGTYDKKINWDGTQSTWNSGVLLYSYWNGGQMQSKSSPTEQSYYSDIDQFGLPVQTTDFSNNRGFGYNFALDSIILGGSISNGNFINVNVGSASSIYSALDIHLGLSQSFAVTLMGGSYKYCDIDFTDITSSSIVNSRVVNNKVSNSKITNSQVSESAFVSSQYKSDSAIKILAYNKEYYKNPGLTSSIATPSDSKTVHKFYISDNDYFKLKAMESFYLKGIKVNKSSVQVNSVMNYFDRRFIFDHFMDNEDPTISSDVSILCQTRTKDENYWISSIVTTSPGLETTTYSVNSIALPSIDIIFTRLQNTDDYTIDITDGYIMDSDFYSGIFENSTWESGNHFNIRDYLIQRISGNYLDMSLSGTFPNFQLEIQLANTASVTFDIVKPNEIIYLDAIDYDLGYQNFNVSGRYKVVSITPLRRILVSEYLVGTESSRLNAVGMAIGGTFSTLNLTPNYNAISKLDINKSIIKAGVFSGNYFRNSNIASDTMDLNDSNLIKSNIDQLKIVNFIFRNNNNTVNSGFIYNSFWNNGTWNNGIINESIWYGGTFSNGIFKFSGWKGGIFQNGLFTTNNDNASTGGRSVVYSYNNEYYLWEDGTFNNGQFYNSNWYDGIFNNGKFYKSLWYDGNWQNGTLGDKNLSNTDTWFIGGSWSNGVVENAIVGSTISNVDWYDGTFNNGVFTGGATSQGTWNTGIFNGGDFSGYAKWKNGEFNGGKFLSIYGATLSTTTASSNFSWENGKFNGGVFGNALVATNSTWFDGEFNGGIFQGMLWNNGVFYNGIFYGSGTYSVRSEEQSYYNSFSASNHYGLWRNGWVVDNKDTIIKDKKIFSIIQRKSDEKRPQPQVEMNNILWVGGTFSHKGGTIKSSMWTDGAFVNGTFYSSTFNPWVSLTSSISGTKANKTIQYIQYVSPTFSGTTVSTSQISQPEFNYNTASCVWYNGIFDSGDFYYSDWYNGTFKNGTMSGAIWHDGVWKYGDAQNIYWMDGTWKNGNWYGSNIIIDDIAAYSGGSFGFIGNVTSISNNPSIVYQTNGNSLKKSNIIWRVMNATGTHSAHTWNTISYPGATAYHAATNNKQVNVYNQIIYSGSNYQYGLTIPNYNTSMTGSVTVNGNKTYAKIGSGTFESGVWENGVWNNGSRIDSDVNVLDGVFQFLRIDEKNWRILLTGLTNSTAGIGIGDKVTIGNLIAIDVNENRRLIREVFTVIDRSDVDIVFQFKTNFPIRRIERDSEYHKIYVTKNIWKSGAFLNGVFENGVWGNGIFKGFPYLTQMKNAHWIDGEFYGGHFYGTHSRVAGTWSVATYSTAVIQNFRVFSDENVWSGPINSATASAYNSWIDVNYEANYSATKLYYDSYLLSYDQVGTPIYTNKVNHYGDITFDVLSSNSKFRDKGTPNTRFYSLGTKYKKYQDFMGENSEFNDINILDYGWTYSILGSYLGVKAEQYVDPDSSDGNGILSIYATSSMPANSYSYVYLQSSDFTPEKRRYTLCEFDSMNRNLGTASIFLKISQTIYPRVIFADDKYNSSGYVFFNNSSAEVMNHYNTNTGSTKKFEYFYNKKSLDLLIIGSFSNAVNTGYHMDNVKSYEVDMIPFFNYWNPYMLAQFGTVNLINSGFSIPYSATANFIDFDVVETNDSFDSPSISPEQIINNTPSTPPKSSILVKRADVEGGLFKS